VKRRNIGGRMYAIVTVYKINRSNFADPTGDKIVENEASRK
jgi:hypothetical protein